MKKSIDLTGQRFGRWTVIERDYEIQKKNIYWKCQCDCGTVRSVAGTSLRSGISTSCGCERDKKTSTRTVNGVEDLTGQRFGRWTVIERDLSKDNVAKKGARWICQCDCGTVKSVAGYALRLGRSTSCGCINGENKIIDLTGQRFGNLIVLRRDNETPNKGKGARWICQCDCGNTISVLSGRLRSGQTKSCGCLRHNPSSKRNTDSLVGKTIGFWTVLSKDESKKGKGVYYICQCVCGNIRSISAYTLNKGFSKSCGCKKTDLTGQRFGNLTVIEIDNDIKGKGVYWKCQCDCGNTKSILENNLIKGHIRSCGCLNRKLSSDRRFIDLTGQRFERLTVIEFDHKEKDIAGNSSIYWKCKCDCGKEIVAKSSSLRNGDIRSCGCLQAEASAIRAKERIIDLVGKRFGLLTVIERVELDENGLGFGKWKCQCDCGNIKLADGYYLRRGMISSCGCLKQSKLELYVLQYFDEKGYINSIDYDYQKRFPDLRGYGEGMLSYDFALYENHEIKMLIECQGQQHYTPVGLFGGKEQFAKQQLHDEIKKEYAQKLGVPLIEIPYYVETFEDVKTMLIEAGV